MRQFFAIIESIFHKREGHKAWNKTKYCLVLGYKTYEIPQVLGAAHCYDCVEFETRQEAIKYLEENVAKSDKKHCHLYKEIKNL